MNYDRFNFDFLDGDTEEKLRVFEEHDFKKQQPGKFTIIQIDWNQSLLEAFIKAFQYFKEKDILWEEIVLDINASEQCYTRPLLRTINSLSISESLSLWFSGQAGQGESLFPQISQSKNLERLNVWAFSTAVSQCDSLALMEFLKTTKRLKVLSLWGMNKINFQLFCKGIVENNTVEELSLDFRNCEISDKEISIILQALSPLLRDLSIRARGNFDSLSSDAIKGLLAKSSSLSRLSLSGDKGVSNHMRLDIRRLIDGLKKNRSLIALNLENIASSELIFSRIFEILPFCPCLESLWLTQNRITRLDIERIIHQRRLYKPFYVGLPMSIIETASTSVKNLLYCHPEIQLFFYSDLDISDTKPPKDIEHIWAFNRHGRYLLLDRQKQPLSLWPLVLEKVNKEPRFVYEFMKGPVFAARES